MSLTLPWLFPVVRGLILLSLLLLIGCATAQRLVRRHLSDIDRNTTIRLQLGLLILPRLLATFLLALCLARSILQLLSFMPPGEPVDPAFARAVLIEGSWGTANLMQTIAAGLLFAACTLARARWREMGIALLVLLPVLIWSQSGLGHGADERWPSLLGRIIHSAHLLGGGLWLGTLAVLAAVVLPALRAPEQGPRLARAIAAFSAGARIGAALVIVSGLAATWRYAVTVDLLVSSVWGQRLLFKLACFAGVCALGWWNWRAVTPALQREHPGSARRLHRAIAAELVLGAAMLLITAVLVGSPLPEPDSDPAISCTPDGSTTCPPTSTRPSPATNALFAASR